jgi:hypothetical protein
MPNTLTDVSAMGYNANAVALEVHVDDENIEHNPSVLLSGTIGLHELFITLQAGGFNEVQATRLIALMIMEGGALGGGDA